MQIRSFADNSRCIEYKLILIILFLGVKAMKNYQSYLDSKKQQYGEKFDSSNLNPAFIPYYENQKRIEVDFGDDKIRGRIGVTTGWKPCFLLMRTTRSIGSSWTIGKTAKIVKVISA